MAHPEFSSKTGASRARPANVSLQRLLSEPSGSYRDKASSGVWCCMWGMYISEKMKQTSLSERNMDGFYKEFVVKSVDIITSSGIWEK